MAERDLPRIDYAAHPLYGGIFAPKPHQREMMVEALKPHVEEIEGCEALRASQFGYRYGWNDELSQELAVDGAATRQLPARALDQIHDHLRPAIELVQERIAAARAA